MQCFIGANHPGTGILDSKILGKPPLHVGSKNFTPQSCKNITGFIVIPDYSFLNQKTPRQIGQIHQLDTLSVLFLSGKPPHNGTFHFYAVAFGTEIQENILTSLVAAGIRKRNDNGWFPTCHLPYKPPLELNLADTGKLFPMIISSIILTGTAPILVLVINISS